MKSFTCKWCGKLNQKNTGEVNRALYRKLPLYCNRTCAGLGRRTSKTEEQKIQDKRIYDMQYRAKNLGVLKIKKKKYFQETYDPIKAAKERKKNMARHVEYCRTPEYKKWKESYDRKHRAKKQFGDFWESFCVLQDLEKEIETRATKYEIYQTNGTLNKHQQRRREYEKLISNQS